VLITLWAARSKSFIERMEEVLEIYERPYNPQEPVVCLDEKPSTVPNTVKFTSFCRYPKMYISDASVQNDNGLVSLEVFSRQPGGRGEPSQFLHAYTLAELGRHAEAASAFEQLGAGLDTVYHQEHHAYEVALKWTQDCAAQRSCMAQDFLAIGNNKEAMHWQSQLFKNLQQDAR